MKYIESESHRYHGKRDGAQFQVCGGYNNSAPHKHGPPIHGKRVWPSTFLYPTCEHVLDTFIYSFRAIRPVYIIYTYVGTRLCSVCTAVMCRYGTQRSKRNNKTLAAAVGRTTKRTTTKWHAARGNTNSVDIFVSFLSLRPPDTVVSLTFDLLAFYLYTVLTRFEKKKAAAAAAANNACVCVCVCVREWSV